MESDNRRVEGSVVVPALQSLISGVAASLIFGISTLAVRRWVWPVGDWRDTLLIAAIAFSCGFACVWAALTWATRPRPAREPSHGMEMPVQRERIVPVFTSASRVVNASQEPSQRAQRFREFIMACGESTARRSLLKRGFTTEEYEEFTAVLLRLGLLRRRNTAVPQVGFEMTCSAEEALRRVRL